MKMARRENSTVWRKIAALAMAVAVGAAPVNQAHADTYTDANGVEWKFFIGTATPAADEGSIGVSLCGDESATTTCISKDAVVDAADIPWTFEKDGVNYTVTHVCGNAFNGCTGLTGILAIPTTVKKIGWTTTGAAKNNPFASTGLTGISSFGGLTSNTCQGLFKGSTGLAGKLVIPDTFSVAFDNYAFHGCSSLTAIVVGSGVTGTGRYFGSNATSLKGVWVKGRPTTSSASQPTTTVRQPHMFQSSTKLKVVLFGEHTSLDQNNSPGNAMFDSVEGCTVFVPNKGKWDECNYGGTDTKVITYGANTNLDIAVDEVNNAITFTPTDETALLNVLDAAPHFKDAFGWNAKINITNTIEVAAGVITSEKLNAVEFNTLLLTFAVKTQAQLNDILNKFPASTYSMLAIDPTGLTETLTVPAGRNVYVKLSEGLQVKKHVDGFIIIFQ